MQEDFARTKVREFCGGGGRRSRSWSSITLDSAKVSCFMIFHPRLSTDVIRAPKMLFVNNLSQGGGQLL